MSDEFHGLKEEVYMFLERLLNHRKRIWEKHGCKWNFYLDMRSTILDLIDEIISAWKSHYFWRAMQIEERKKQQEQ